MEGLLTFDSDGICVPLHSLRADVKMPRPPRRQPKLHRHPFTCLSSITTTPDDVMAANPAVKAINTQEFTDKARRDLLQLLESVCKRRPCSTDATIC